MSEEIQEEHPAFPALSDEKLSNSVAARWDATTRAAFNDVIAAIRIHGEDLAALPGVVAVRPGYRFRKGRITSQPAVVVTVLQKQDLADVATPLLIPRKLGKVMVDVAPASPVEQWLALQAQAESAEASVTNPRIDFTLPGDLPQSNLPEMALAAVSLLPYETWLQEPLAAVEEDMTVVCHASPDAGWRNLKQFLLATQERLTCTMYEFTGRHILETLAQAMNAPTTATGTPRTLRLILDPKKEQATPNVLMKDEVVTTLKQALGNRFAFEWAAVPSKGRTTNGFFPNAYHIKVSVRDGETLWLSSGNWKPSNQPIEDPIEGPFPANLTAFQREHNRDWHIILDNKTLAKLYEDYIQRDITQAEPLQAVPGDQPVGQPMPDLFVPLSSVSTLAAAQPQFWKEMKLTRKLKVQPILTPDNYMDFVEPLIAGAQHRVYFQNQSLNPKPGSQLKPEQQARYAQLIQTLAAKSKEPGMDVRIIIRDAREFNAPDNREALSALVAHGFDPDRIKFQFANHNKGIIVDTTAVVIGSHNCTGDGTIRNRDASLIFFDTDIIAYFERFFLNDWNNLATFENAQELAMPRLALAHEPTPPGMMRIAWDAYFEG